MKTASSSRESEDFVFCLAFEDKRRGRNYVIVLPSAQIKTILFSFSTPINHGCRLPHLDVAFPVQTKSPLLSSFSYTSPLHRLIWRTYGQNTRGNWYRTRYTAWWSSKEDQEVDRGSNQWRRPAGTDPLSGRFCEVDTCRLQEDIVRLPHLLEYDLFSLSTWFHQ